MATYQTIYARYSNRPRRKDISPERALDNLPTWVHPVFRYYFADWKIIRDASEGEKDVKDGREFYLPMLEGMEPQEYEVYLSMATFYNFTGRTAGALQGTLLKKDPTIDGIPADLVDGLEHITEDGDDVNCMIQKMSSEYLKLGRHGLLVDLPATPSTAPTPFVVHYVAENIVDWTYGFTASSQGRKVPTRIVLREYVEKRLIPQEPIRYFARYRVLELVNNIYTVSLYENEIGDANLNEVPTVAVPTRRGQTLDFIPFVMVGEWKGQKPPLNDIARLNISHYKSYGLLEHGRFYTGLPIYWAEIQGTGRSEYVIAPNRVWEMEKGTRPGVIEFNGAGLRFLENALVTKEAQAASLGGRMIGDTANSTAETDNQTKMKDRNEQSMLLTSARVLSWALTQSLRWWAWWSNASDDDIAKIYAEYDRSFLYDAIGSREFRAIQALFKDGMLPIDVVWDYMRKAEVIPDNITADEFRTMLLTANQFPNQPDFQARQEGYANAQSKTSAELKGKDQDQVEEEIEIQREEVQMAADQAAFAKTIQLRQQKLQEKQAAVAAKAATAPAAAGNPAVTNKPVAPPKATPVVGKPTKPPQLKT